MSSLVEGKKRRKYEGSREGAWWFRRRGQEPIDVSTSTHIAMLIKQPQVFGLTKEFIKEAYDKEGERVGTEGKAREKLIKLVTKNGWVRIRHYNRPRDYWSFTVWDFRTRRSDLADFCWWAITEGLMSESDELVFYSVKDNSTDSYSFMHGGAKKFLNEKKKNRMLKNLIDRFKK